MQKLFWWPSLDHATQRFVEKHNGPVFPSDLWERGLIMLAVCLVLLYLAQKFFSRQESKFPERL
jgi:ABC-2 type transport system permease protein